MKITPGSVSLKELEYIFNNDLSIKLCLSSKKQVDKSAGIVENVIYLSWSIFYEDRVISVAGSLIESDYNNETEKQIRAIVTSIYFEDLFK